MDPIQPSVLEQPSEDGVVADVAPLNADEDAQEQHLPALPGADATATTTAAHAQAQAPPAKKIRYDRLGRAVDASEEKRAASSGPRMKKPRGRPPKNKKWDDGRGEWVDDNRIA